jgi:hypothetical protein
VGVRVFGNKMLLLLFRKQYNTFSTYLFVIKKDNKNNGTK